LDPASAFSLNNVGFVAEMQGDTETAEYFYEKARSADGARAKVAVATNRSAEGQKLADVADDSDKKVDDKISELHEQKLREGGPIQFYRRPGTQPPPSQSAPSQEQQQPSPQPSSPNSTSPTDSNPGTTTPNSQDQSPNPQ
jgi:hypothetical protein